MRGATEHITLLVMLEELRRRRRDGGQCFFYDFIWLETLVETVLRDTSERHGDFYSPYRAAQIDGTSEGVQRDKVCFLHVSRQTLYFCVL